MWDASHGICDMMKHFGVGTEAPFQRQEVTRNKNRHTSITQRKKRLSHKTDQPHPTSAKQTVRKSASFWTNTSPNANRVSHSGISMLRYTCGLFSSWTQSSWWLSTCWYNFLTEVKHKCNFCELYSSPLLSSPLYAYILDCPGAFSDAACSNLHNRCGGIRVPVYRDRRWVTIHVQFNSSPPRQFGGKIADDIFKRIFVNENDWMSIKISLKFIHEGPIDNKSVLVQVMAWRRQATSHYLNQCWPSFLTHICGTRGRWVNHGDAMPRKRFPHYLPFVRGIIWWTVDSLHKER